MTLSERDRKIIWHPYSQEKTADLPIAVRKASGSYLYDDQGNEYLDLISSWWVNLHGHANPEIAKAIYDQALSLEHVIFAGFTHAPAVTLCEKLRHILPQNLTRFFFSDNGSTAVEIALKTAYQYHYNRGFKERTLFMSFEGGYHGDTFGAMSVGNKSGFHDIFQSLFFDVITVPYPETWDGDERCVSKEQEALAFIEHKFVHQGTKIASIIIEPLIQGASGMRVCRPEFITEVVKLAKKYDILTIFDEVMTGFCRTGTYFAADRIKVEPDFICLSKGITGGFLPLALTVTTNEIYEAFLSDDVAYAFMHGHSYTANPLACVAAIKSLELLTSRKTQEAVASISEIHRMNLHKLKESHADKIRNIRILGTIAAFEVTPSEVKEFESLAEENINKYLKKAFLNKNLLIRPIKNVIYLMPPYCITGDELEQAYRKIDEVLNETLGREKVTR